MAGQSGQVTLRLPYPVKVKAVTLDHASALLFENKKDGRNSAPKHVRVFGYPPCWVKKEEDSSVKKSDYLDEDDDEEQYVRGICDDGLDFDLESPIVLHDIEYDLDGPSIQTFHIPLPPEEEEGDGASCSEETKSCGGDDPLGGNNHILYSSSDRTDTINEGVTAIRVEVTDNWGNEDYTCIYRFRVHGDALDPNNE